MNSTVAALATLLSRQFCAAPEPDDEQLAAGLVSQLGGSDELMIAAAAAVWVAFGNQPEEMPEEVWSTAAAIVRGLDRDASTTELTTFAAAALALLAAAERTSRPARDLVQAANMARRGEQHLLAAACARAALDRAADLSEDGRVLARMTLAVATRDVADVEALYATASGLPPGSPIRAIAESLRPSLHPDGRADHISAAGEAIMADDRRGAAAAMVREIDEMKARYREDDLLRGLHRAFTALVAPALDPEMLAAALPPLMSHIRDRQRFGELPLPARAGIDMLLSMLTIRAGSAEAAAMIELMDGLADSGLDQFLGIKAPVAASRGDVVSAEITQASIAANTARGLPRRDAERVMATLDGHTAVIFRERSTRNARGFVALHLRPPDGVSVKNRAYPPSVVTALAALASQARSVTADAIDAAVDVDELVDYLLPARLKDDLEDALLTRLLVVPDGDLWFVPWTAARLLADVDVRLLPSLPREPPVAATDGRVQSVLAIVDDNAPGADLVVDALHAARARGALRIAYSDDLPGSGRDNDLLLFFGHGAGRGLSYGLQTPRGRRTALDVVHSGGFRQALLAACWSAGSPAPGSQISVPAALLASGINPVVGGTWPLPGAETGRVIARALVHLQAGTGLPVAVRRAFAEVQAGPACWWGIAVFGA